MFPLIVCVCFSLSIMNLLTTERFPKGFLSTASVAKWIGHWSQVQEVVESNLALGKLFFSLIIESKRSKSIQMSESRNSMQTIDY